MRIRSLLASGAVLLAAAGGTVATAGAASATSAHHPRTVSVATGSVALSSPIQYAKFVVRTGPGHNHGFFNYTNFTSPEVGTNVWNIGGASQLNFTLGSTTYAHTMKIITVTPLSTHSTSFSGTGYYDNQPIAYAWTIAGTVDRNAVSFMINYTGSADPGYWVKASGMIAADGSVSGTATDRNGATLSFTMPTASAFEVLNYTAPVPWVAICGHNASFVFTIPATAPTGLAGLHIIVKVHDGGPGFANDTYAAGIATSPHNGPVTNYPITSGNIRVFKIHIH